MRSFMRILFDSKSPVHKSPFGCIHEDESCTLTVLVPSSCMTNKIFTVIESDDGFLMHIPMKKIKTEAEYEHYSASFSLYRRGLYFYYFKIETPNDAFSLFRYGYSDTNIEEGERWQLSCIKKDGYNTSSFYSGAVYYQIFPDRFYKENILPSDGKIKPFKIHESENDIPDYMPNENGQILNNDFFGGNFAGIEKKLPYIKSLGVDVIYLNPIFFAYSNHRYDTADYLKPDPLLGTKEDFISLCDSAHALGMKIILDGVFSHTGADSIYFDKSNRFGNGAYHVEASPYRSWYSFGNDKSYTSWWGIDTLPCVNELAPSFLNYITDGENSVVSYWLNCGADGFRLDVADELPDEFILRLHERVHAVKPDAIVIGEVWEDASNKISYGKRRTYFTEAELDSVMNYPFRSAVIDFVKGNISSNEFSESVMTICENYPAEVLSCLMNSLSTHDTERILTLLADTPPLTERCQRAEFKLCGSALSDAQSREKAAVFLQFMLPGCPCIYYGDEAGAEGFEDPFNRGFFPWGNENEDLLAHYKKLSFIKASYPSIKNGSAEVYSPYDGTVLIKRHLDGETMYAAVCPKGGYVVPGEIIYSNADGKILPENGFALYK